MSNAIDSSRESNPSRRICHLRPVPLGHVPDKLHNHKSNKHQILGVKNWDIIQEKVYQYLSNTSNFSPLLFGVYYSCDYVTVFHVIYVVYYVTVSFITNFGFTSGLKIVY